MVAGVSTLSHAFAVTDCDDALATFTHVATCGRQRIVLLAGDVKGLADDAHAEIAEAPLFVLRAKRQQTRRHSIGHGARQFKRIALGAADHAVRAKKRWNEMKNARVAGRGHRRARAWARHTHFTASSSIDRNQAGNIQAQRRS